MDLNQKVITDLHEQTNDQTKMSIYMPTHPRSSSQTMEEDRIRFKNALARLDSHETRSNDELGKTYKDLQALVEQVDFWQHQELSLAVFADGETYQALKLPYEINEIALLSDNYITSPLMLMHSIRFSFYVFDINLEAPTLYLGNSHGLRKVDDINLPKSMEDEIDLDDMQKQTQFHTGAAGGGAMFHGHGAEKDNKQSDIDRYMQLVTDSLEAYLKHHDVPIVLAGTEKRVAQLRRMMSYGRVLGQTLPPAQDTKHDTMHEGAHELLSNAVREHQSHELERYNNLLATKLAIEGDMVAEAAKSGRVDTLYVSCLRETRDSVRDGDFTATRLELPENILQLESVVADVVSNGGKVLAVEKSAFDNEELHAVCRF